MATESPTPDEGPPNPPGKEDLDLPSILFEQCRDFHIFRLVPNFRFFGLALFIFSNTVLLFSVIWWWKNRSNPRLVVRSASGLVLTALYSVLDSFSRPLHWYSLSSLSVLNRCEFRWFFTNLSGFAFLSAVGLRIFLYEQRFYLFNEISKGCTDTIDSRKLDSSQPSVDSANKKLRKIYYRSSNYFAQKLALVTGIVCVAISLLLTATTCPKMSSFAKCPNRDPKDGLFEYTMTVAGIVFLMAMLSAYRTRFFPDPFDISKEALVNASIALLGFATSYLLFYVRLDLIAESFELTYTPFFPVSLAAFLNMLYSIPFQVFLSTRKQLNRKPELSFGDVLQNPGALRMFRQHVAIELSEDNLDFYLAVKRWRDEYEQTPGEVRKKIADNICRKWLNEESVSEVSVSFTVKNSLFNEMKKGSNYKLSIFDEISREMYQLMENDSFCRFKSGPVYRIFIGLSLKDGDIETSHSVQNWLSKRRLTEL